MQSIADSLYNILCNSRSIESRVLSIWSPRRDSKLLPLAIPFIPNKPLMSESPILVTRIGGYSHCESTYYPRPGTWELDNPIHILNQSRVFDVLVLFIHILPILAAGFLMITVDEGGTETAVKSSWRTISRSTILE